MTFRASVKLAMLLLAAILVLSVGGVALFGEWSLEIGTLVFIATAVVIAFDHERRHFSAMRQLTEGLAALREERDDTTRQLEGIVYLYGRLQPELPLPPFNKATIKPDFAERLAGEVLSREAPVVVELGSGISTAIVGLCLKKLGTGRMLSFDHETKYAGLTRNMLAQQRVSDFAQVTHAPLKTQRIGDRDWNWYDIDVASLPLIDVLLVDGPPRETQALARYPALPLLYEKLKPGAMIYLDDGRRSDEQEIARRWQAEFPGIEHVPFPTQSGVIAFRKP
ncbi:MAG: class I SAM-dependent methyltransferase [Planctomycetes bacterium]|nr:class I SAM-dependent methyltransferase [Planctomycetota bacterium]